MTDRELVISRIVAQHLHSPTGGTVAELVREFVAMQGQDLPGVVSSIALRTGAGIEGVTEAFDRGAIVRAYPMRGTVFVMAAEDARWVSELCNASAVRAQESRRPALGLEDAHFSSARRVLERETADGGCTKQHLLAAWDDAGVDTGGGRGYHVLTYLIATGVAVYGPLAQRDNTVRLAEEWLPAATTLEARFNGDRVAATTELLHRYFSSRGPATIRDAAWWSKLPLSLLREAARGFGNEIEVLHTDEPSYRRAQLPESVEGAGRTARAPMLLPGFDELVLGYQDRGYIAPEQHLERLVPGGNGVFRPTAVASGQVRGTWKRTGRPGKRRFELDPFASVSDTRRRAFERAFAKFPFATP
ncbi:winged helix DNA-binding domain-containing protein [uncultured Agrococcus sp.]|uniref:winged helix DNA-binding domain-containing protein n=1 Tax=uncultured Agrococcus sp. TaxID=382258 RepID=UPI0025FDC4CB|nr:winged helix DNA-binding domain-containing protein [uncultured Agrococcus sp.]